MFEQSANQLDASRIRENAPFLVQAKLLERWMNNGKDELEWVQQYAALYRRFLQEQPERIADIAMRNLQEDDIERLQNELTALAQH